MAVRTKRMLWLSLKQLRPSSTIVFAVALVIALPACRTAGDQADVDFVRAAELIRRAQTLESESFRSAVRDYEQALSLLYSIPARYPSSVRAVEIVEDRYTIYGQSPRELRARARNASFRAEIEASPITALLAMSADAEFDERTALEATVIAKLIRHDRRSDAGSRMRALAATIAPRRAALSVAAALLIEYVSTPWPAELELEAYLTDVPLFEIPAWSCPHANRERIKQEIERRREARANASRFERMDIDAEIAVLLFCIGETEYSLQIVEAQKLTSTARDLALVAARSNDIPLTERALESFSQCDEDRSWKVESLWKPWLIALAYGLDGNHFSASEVIESLSLDQQIGVWTQTAENGSQISRGNPKAATAMAAELVEKHDLYHDLSSVAAVVKAAAASQSQEQATEVLDRALGALTSTRPPSVDDRNALQTAGIYAWQAGAYSQAVSIAALQCAWGEVDRAKAILRLGVAELFARPDLESSVAVQILSSIARTYPPNDPHADDASQ